MPPPEPRSSTTSPALSCASAVGLPHPSDAATASAGSSDVSPHPYRFDVIGSRSPREEAVPQHDASPPAATRSAALPYLSLTTACRSFSAMKACSYQALDVSVQKKGSVAASYDSQAVRARLDRRDGRLDLGDRMRLERVIDPAPLAPITEESRILQGLQVERQARLTRLEDVGEITDALLAAAQLFDDAETRRVRQRVEQIGGPLQIDASPGCHARQHIKHP